MTQSSHIYLQENPDEQRPFIIRDHSPVFRTDGNIIEGNAKRHRPMNILGVKPVGITEAEMIRISERNKRDYELTVQDDKYLKL